MAVHFVCYKSACQCCMSARNDLLSGFIWLVQGGLCEEFDPWPGNSQFSAILIELSLMLIVEENGLLNICSLRCDLQTGIMAINLDLP